MRTKAAIQSVSKTAIQLLIIIVFSNFTHQAYASQPKAQAVGKTLLISDIDDTIRPTHILSLTDKYTNQLTADQFLGMLSLFRLIEKQNPQTYIYYVTNAPDAYGLNFLPALYLYNNNFPQQENLSLNDDSTAVDIQKKVPRISKLIDYMQPKKLILVGDNGQVDIGVYQEIRRRYPSIPAEIYIHQVYSVNSVDQQGARLMAGQKGFVTAIDIATDLFRQGVIKENGLTWLAQKTIPQILAESYVGGSGDTAFYSWMDCRDYHFSSDTNDLPLSIQTMMKSYFAKLSKRCSIPAIRQ